jgi:F0F1-type ATP synthase beta subunit
VLFFVDNIFRFTQAGSEVSALLGRIPSAVGYQPTLATDMGNAAGAHHLDQQGLDHLGAGHLRPGRRPDRPGPGRLVRPPGRDDRAVRAIAEPGIYPAVDPLDSTSRDHGPRWSSARSTMTASPVRSRKCCSSTRR